MRIALWLALAVLFARPAHATFSIVAVDPATGELGVALGSMAFGASERVPFGQGGVGVIAGQSNNNVGYQMRAIELLKSGLTAQQVVEKLLAEDTFPGKEGRQFAIADASGNIAVHMGPSTAQPRGVRQRPTYAVIGNNLLGAHVVDAVGAAFETSRGELSERLYAALKAGELAGGDREPLQSAAILVFRVKQFDNNDRWVSVRVDHGSDPMYELRRLLNLQLARNYAATRNYLVRTAKMTEALEAASKAAEYEPTVADNHLHLGFLSYVGGGADRALQAFARARQLNPDFRKAWDAALASAQFAAYGRIRDDAAFVGRVMAAPAQ
jgi:uncharacterized Ntn-hydrolase superfamily protein